MKLSQIEKSIFNNIQKSVEESTNNVWIGSKEQNSLADLKIATSIKNSFRQYETSKAKKEKSYFKF